MKTGTCFDRVYPPELTQKELACIALRRQNNGGSAPKGSSRPHLPPDTVGLALSGGGIRSATFCLGVLQALAQRRLLQKIDFLSTVSGGGYIGSCLGRLFTRPQATPASVEATLADPRSHCNEWLRDNGRYLSPNGAGDDTQTLAAHLRAWIALHFTLGLFVVTLFLLANAVRALLWPWGRWQSVEGWFADRGWLYLWWSPWWCLSLGFMVVIFLPLAWAYWLTQSRAPGARGAGWGDSGPRGLTIMACLGGIGLGAWIMSQGLWQLVWAPAGLVLLSGLALGWAVVALRRSRAEMCPAGVQDKARNLLTQWLCPVFVLGVILIAFSVADMLGQTLYAYAHQNSMAKYGPIGFGAIGGVLGALANKLGVLFGSNGRKRQHWPIPLSGLAVAAGLLLLTLYLAMWSLAAHALLWKAGIPAPDPSTRIWNRHAPPGTVKLSDEHYVTVLPSAPAALRPGAEPSVGWCVIGFLIAALVNLGLRTNLGFLNLSSFQRLYSTRLARAYLGASNPEREKQEFRRLSDTAPGDDTPYSLYAPHESGGPLHLINVTFNETVDGQYDVEQRDRKGLPLVVGPAGLTVGASHHALWADEPTQREDLLVPPPSADQFRIFSALPEKPTRGTEPAVGRSDELVRVTPEALNLSTWIGISGAAFSTALGAQTNLGLSILAALNNVRLGYWWDSGLKPNRRYLKPENRKGFGPRLASWFPLQFHLMDELLGHYHGPARRRWYLTDGGHYENTAAYELLRRRIPLIVVCDNGADENYEFADLANLVRKARVDFDAEVRFLNEEQTEAVLDKSFAELIVTLQQLRRRRGAKLEFSEGQSGAYRSSRYSRGHAALAWVTYDISAAGDLLGAGANNPTLIGRNSILLVLKPSLTGDEDADVLNYHRENPAFPQQSTLDQFFEEAQWESYRYVGEHIAAKLWAPVQGAENAGQFNYPLAWIRNPDKSLEFFRTKLNF